MIQFRSCLGSPFSILSVKVIVNSSRGIDGLLSTGMITQYKGSNNFYCFAHDNIKEAASSLVPENDNICLYMGIKLWTLLPAEELDCQIFTVADLLMSSNLSSEKDSLKLVKLFSRAGERAMSITAFEKACHYFKAALGLLGVNCWENNYSMTLELYNNAARSAFGMQIDSMLNEVKEVVLRNASSPADLVEIYSLIILRFGERTLFKDAIDTAMFILNKLGERIDHNVYDNASIALAIERVKKLFLSKSGEKIIDMKEMSETYKPIMSIFTHVFQASYSAFPNLFVYASIRMVEITLHDGLSKDSAVGEKSITCTSEYLALNTCLLLKALQILV